MAAISEPPVVDDPDAPGPPISVSESGEAGEGGRLRMIVSLLKRALGVKDIAAMRLSLPASLLEPVPNLEYWQYLDRPDLFAGMNDSADPFERFLAVLRFMFSKDLKFIHGKVCKPYNSVLGEFFVAHWDVVPVSYPDNDKTEPPIQHLYLLAPHEDKPSKTKSTLTLPQEERNHKSFTSIFTSHSASSSPAPSLVEQNLSAGISQLSLGSERSLAEGASVSSNSNIPSDRVRVLFLTEQICHHPPISAFHYAVPSKGIWSTGVDQIAARVSGATVKIAPGSQNKGIFIFMDDGPGKGEKYQITHPTASVNGVLTGRFYATVSDSSIVTVSGGENWRAVIEYKDEGWISSPKFLLEGVIHTFDPESTEHESWTRVRHVPAGNVIARLEGCWKNVIRYQRTGEKEWKTLIDLSNLMPMPKVVRPLEEQLPNESRRLWEKVTNNLLKKEYGEATKFKVQIEELQRDLAAARRKKGEVFIPEYFESDIESGIPAITDKGRELLKQEDKSPL